MYALFLSCLLLSTPDAIPAGKSEIQVKFDDVTMTLFTYKPDNFRDGPLLMVFHGVLRNADEYRDHSIPMGNRFGALIVAPLFDADSFPKPKYQFGGIVRDGKAVRAEERTGEYVNRIAREIRRREGRTELPYALIGHSGGGQFLGRLASFVNTDATRIVIANPSSYTLPTLDQDFPYGFGGLPAELQNEEMFKAYLARPVTIYVGSNDTIRDEYFDDSAQADRQGKSRFERGKNAYEFAERLAREKNWPFQWKLVIAHDVEHDHEKMFNHPECATALGWKQKVKD
ncbi:MAG: hypothetical protein JSS49_01200 [Planctomycetes bacterium]|nr:hypothetical protein [Planctomycetota bacterium]